MAQLSQVLLFEPDPSGLDTLTYGLEREGCAVTPTGDPATARELIQNAFPSLVIVSLRGSERIGLDLLRSTTSSPRTRNLACVGIGPDDSRTAALAAGAFAFLATPLFVRDVLGACRLVAAASIPGSRPSPDAEISLGLADLEGVYFLVRTMAVTGRSSVVEVRHEARRGELRFIDGALTSSQVGSVEGLPALHKMLLWDDGTLAFKFKNVVRRGSQLSMKSTEVVEECDRFLRDFAHEVRDLGYSRTIYAAGSKRVHPSAALPAEVVPLLKLFDGRHNLGQVLQESPFRAFDTLKIIRRFISDGAIEAKTALPQLGRNVSPPQAGPSALDFWWQRKVATLGAEIGAVPSQVVADAGRGLDGGEPSLSSSPMPSVTAVGAAIAERSDESQAVPDENVTKKNDDVGAPADGSPGAAQDKQASAQSAPGLGRRNATVVRGEIEIAFTPTVDKTDIDGPVGPSVVIAIESSFSPAMPATAPSNDEPAAATVIVAPFTPAPGMPAGLPQNDAATTSATTFPAPVTANAPAAQAKRGARSPSDNFDAVESDFFDREADLYKRESVENFDDLDRSNHPARVPGLPVRKR